VTISPIAQTSIIAPGRRRQPDASEGSVASGKALGEVARLSSDEALQQLSGTADGLTPNRIEERLRSVGRNQLSRRAIRSSANSSAARLTR
jgi:P-type Mg2+ transporter